MDQFNQQLNHKWLSLNEYSNKYKVSISTLRRRLRQGQLSYQVKSGKYFLKDMAFSQALASHSAMSTSPVSAKKPACGASSAPSHHISHHISHRTSHRTSHMPSSIYEKETAKKTFTVKQPVQSLVRKPVTQTLKKPLLKESQDSSFYLKILEFQKDFLHKLDKKDQKIAFLQEQIGDLQTLVALLEKENKQLKLLSKKEQTLNKWLDDNP